MNKFYIYNLRQANYFFSKGLMPMLVDKGRKGDVYVEFERNAESEKVFKNWCDLCKKSKEEHLSESEKRISIFVNDILQTA